jgi:hypothetical protein
MKTLLLFILPFVLIGCQPGSNQAKDASIPGDTSFRFTIRNQVNFIDSKDRSYSRAYVKGAKTVHFRLLKEDIQELIRIYLEKRLDTLPDKYAPNCKPDVTPTFEDEITVGYKGMFKKFIYNPDFECFDSISAATLRNIDAFQSKIHEILQKDKAVQELPASDILFM